MGYARSVLAGAESGGDRMYLDGYVLTKFPAVIDVLISPGIQMYWGGQAVRIVLASVIGPKFFYMKNTIPSSANVQTVDLVSFIIFVLILGECC